MRRYWLFRNDFYSSYRIDGDLFHHIFIVCRQKVGDQFELLGRGDYADLVEVTEVSKKFAKVDLISERLISPIPKPLIQVNISIPRFAVFESVLERLVELGVYTVKPFISEFSFVRSLSGIEPKRWERWKKIIVSATEQCGRASLMALEPPKTLNDLMTGGQPDSSIFLYEGDSQITIHERFKSLREKNLELVQLYIGSEGGFSQTEVEQMNRFSIPSVTLGDQVLRVETACLSAVSILKYELLRGDR